MTFPLAFYESLKHFIEKNSENNGNESSDVSKDHFDIIEAVRF